MKQILSNINLRKLGAMGVLAVMPMFQNCGSKHDDPKPATHETTYKFIRGSESSFVTEAQIKSSADSSLVSKIIILPTIPAGSNLNWDIPSTGWSTLLNTYLKPRFDVSSKVTGNNNVFTLKSPYQGTKSDSLALVNYGFKFQLQK